MLRPETVSRRQAAAGVLLLHLVLLCLATSRHALWRDEAQAWLIARDSSSVSMLIRNLRYEGNPPLWHLILYGLTKLSWNPAWMKLPNLLFTVLAAALLLFARRLSFSVRLGLAFSYFLLFEYGVFARNYMLGFVLLLAAATLLERRRDGEFRWVPLLLCLAALSSLPALILAIAMFCVYLAREGIVFERVNGRMGLARPRRWTVIACVLFAGCALASVALIRPPADTGVFLLFPPLPHNPLKLLSRCGSNLTMAYLPIPEWKPQFWNSAILLRLPHHLPWLIGWGVLAGLLLFFRRPAARYFFAGGTALLLLQITVSQRRTMHNLGWLFLCLVLALVLEGADARDDGEAERSGRGWRPWLLGAVLCAQVYSGLFAIGVSLKYTFSHSKDVATYLRRENLAGAPLVFEPDYVGSAVLAYLQRPDDYDLEFHRRGSFIVWNRKEFVDRHLPTRAELDAVTGGTGSPVLITETPLTEGQREALGIRLLTSYEDAICDLDTYYLYR